MDLDIDLLRTFVTIVRTRNFTRAGEIRLRSQSAISMQVKRLESALGMKLFLRERGGGVSLTADGQTLLQYARQIIALNDEVEATVKKGPVDVAAVRVGMADDDCCTKHIPDVCRDFLHRYPMHQIELFCGNTRTLLERLDAGELDIAIATHGAQANTGELLYRQPLDWVSGPGYVTGEGALEIAILSIGYATHDQLLRALHRTKHSRHIIVRSESMAALQHIVRAGFAMTALPRALVPPDFHILNDKAGLPALPKIEVRVHPATGNASRPVAHFTELAIERLRDLCRTNPEPPARARNVLAPNMELASA